MIPKAPKLEHLQSNPLDLIYTIILSSKTSQVLFSNLVTTQKHILILDFSFHMLSMIIPSIIATQHPHLGISTPEDNRYVPSFCNLIRLRVDNVTVCVFSSEPSVVASNTLPFLIHSDWQSLALNDHLLKT